ncbi:AAA domain, putative AbiEii toxin, Type IV TA system [compost metagenome]
MLTMILGIAGAIKDDSLICIDEPEISLHPRWQADIVRQLQTVFEEYQGCHFIIATHSPQIVSGLTTENGYVLSLEDRKFYRSDEYARRSADFQLAEIFNTPGHNNEYLIRIALTLLTKLSNEQPLTNVDRQKIEWLSIIGKDLSDKDPVFHLINQVRMLGLGI